MALLPTIDGMRQSADISSKLMVGVPALAALGVAGVPVIRALGQAEELGDAGNTFRALQSLAESLPENQLQNAQAFWLPADATTTAQIGWRSGDEVLASRSLSDLGVSQAPDWLMSKATTVESLPEAQRAIVQHAQDLQTYARRALRRGGAGALLAAAGIGAYAKRDQIGQWLDGE